MSERDVAIVGMACVFPGAPDLATFASNLARGVDALRDLPRERWPGAQNHEVPSDHEAHIRFRRGGFLDTPHWFDGARYGIMPRIARDGDPDQFLLLDVVARALEDAGVGRDDPRRAATDLIVGRGGYTSNKMMEVFLRSEGIDRFSRFLSSRAPGLGPELLDGIDAALRRTLPPYDVDGLASSIPNLVPSRAANRLDLGGSAFTVDGACASSLLALETAVLRLRDGRAEIAVAAGVNLTQVPAFWWLFDRILAISPSERIRPFDRRADGMLIGEGAGAVVLERLDDAIARRHPVWAIVKGAGSASDGRQRGVLAPAAGGQVRALERAYHDAGVDPETIGLVEAHGTGTREGDDVELETLRRVFGPPRGGVPARPLGSVKSMIGHLMPAAGVAALIKTALSLSNKVVYPSLHCEQPHPALADTSFWVPGAARPWLESPAAPRRAGVDAFGFGGIDAHVVLEEARPVPARATRVVVPGAGRTESEEALGGPVLVARAPESRVRRATEVLLFSGRDRVAVAARLRRLLAFVRADRRAATLEDLAWAALGEARAQDAARLAFVHDASEPLEPRLDALVAAIESGALETREADLLYVSDPATGVDGPRGRIAAVFPGLAFPGLVGEFPRHLLETCLHFPAAREVFDHVERRDGNPGDPVPTSLLLVPPPHLPAETRAALLARFAPPPRVSASEAEAPARPDARSLSHMGMLANNEAAWRILCSLGVRADMVCGQSLGDVSAVLAAGMTDFEEHVPGFWKAFDIQLPVQGTGIIAMVGASEEELLPFLAAHPGVSIGLHLSPTTQVVGGPETAVRALAEALRGARILAQPLPFPPIHTPHLADVEAEFAKALGKLERLRPARIEIWSAVLGAPIRGDPDDVDRVLRTNVSRPIRFWQTMRRMADEGARFIVQIGSGTMAANSRSVLDRDDVVCVAMDVAHREPLTQIQALAGQLFAHGFAIDRTGLFPARRPAPIDLDRPRDPASPPRAAVPLSFYWPPMHEAPDAPPETEAEAVAPVLAASPAPPVPPQAPRASAARELRAPRGRMPFVGRVTAHEPGVRLETVVDLALAEHPWLADHVFSNARGEKPLALCLPVVPLTMTMEMLSEHAVHLAPGLGLVALEDVRARRWIAFEGVDRVRVAVRAEVRRRSAEAAVVRVEASVGDDRVARADVHLGTRYRETVRFAFTRFPDDRPFGTTARRLYEDGELFHGPRFRCLAELTERRGRGVAGTLEVLRRDELFRGEPDPHLLLDPVTLDGAGQLVGSWFHGEEGYVLPVAVDRVELYRASPAPGTRCPARAELREVDWERRRTVADVEVEDGEGHVWFRLRGWRDAAFRWPRRLLENHRAPRRHLLAEPVEGDPTALGLDPGDVVVWLDADAVRDLPPDWLARNVLHADEEAAWRALDATPRRRRAWLLGRAALKDALRAFLARRAGRDDMLHPAAVSIGTDEAGAPRVREAGGGPAPYLSLSHTEDAAVAVAASGPVGVDLERADAARDLDVASFATEDEVRRLAEAGHPDDPTWATRLWCAKEAAAKARGTGLRGRPKAYEAVRICPDGAFDVRHEGGADLRVRTSVTRGHVLAVALAETAVAGRAS